MKLILSMINEIIQPTSEDKREVTALVRMEESGEPLFAICWCRENLDVERRTQLASQISRQHGEALDLESVNKLPNALTR